VRLSLFSRLLTSHEVELGVDGTRGDGGAAAALAAEFGGPLFSASGGGGGGSGGSAGVPSLTSARQLLTKFAFPASRCEGAD
jgi:hypothetical protein